MTAQPTSTAGQAMPTAESAWQRPPEIMESKGEQKIAYLWKCNQRIPLEMQPEESAVENCNLKKTLKKVYFLFDNLFEICLNDDNTKPKPYERNISCAT